MWIKICILALPFIKHCVIRLYILMRLQSVIAAIRTLFHLYVEIKLMLLSYKAFKGLLFFWKATSAFGVDTLNMTHYLVSVFPFIIFICKMHIEIKNTWSHLSWSDFYIRMIVLRVLVSLINTFCDIVPNIWSKDDFKHIKSWLLYSCVLLGLSKSNNDTPFLSFSLREYLNYDCADLGLVLIALVRYTYIYIYIYYLI